MEKYLVKLIENYGKALTGEIGEGNLKNRLIEGLKDIFNVDLALQILKEYEETLKRELGDGKLKNKILNKLEGILSEEIAKDDLWNKPFDYSAIPNYKTRIKNCLKPIYEKYGDLQTRCYKDFIDKNGGNRSWKGEREYFLFLKDHKYLGKKSANAIISHLKSRNFDFSEESAKKALEKIKGSC